MIMQYYIPRNTPTTKLNRHWDFCVGSGNAASALRTDYTRQLKFIHDELGIKRVRAAGIFNDELHTINLLSSAFPVPEAEKFYECSFWQCGVVYDNILSAGMQPFVEIGRMPKALSDPNTPSSFFGKTQGLPRDEMQWQAYIKRYLHFLIHRYGADEVEQWFFEFWNEPDLSFVFFSGTQNDYFRFYEITARAFREVNPNLKIGGPATSNSKWIRSFLAYCKEHDVPVDFITTHQYAGDPLGGVEATTEEQDLLETAQSKAQAAKEDLEYRKALINELLKKQTDHSLLAGFRAFMGDPSEDQDIKDGLFARNSAIVKEQAEGYPVYYTEWGGNAGNAAYTNDTKKIASYAAKYALAVEQNVTGSSYFLFSDVYSNMFCEEFYGGFGMLTKQGIPKPAFYALKLLTQIGSDRMILRDENGTDLIWHDIAVAGFRSDEGIQLLLNRQKMKLFPELSAESTTITIELERAPTKVTIQRIDDTHCNPMSVWEGMGSPIDLNHQEIAHIKSNSALFEEEFPAEFKDGKLTLQASLKANDVNLIKIYL